MIAQTQKRQFVFGKVRMQWREVVLKLKRNFSTAHSTSSERHNFLVKVSIEGNEMVGLGECGLPPKKPNCYLSDITDCYTFINKLVQKLSNSNLQEIIYSKEMWMKMSHQLLNNMPTDYFRYCRPQEIDKASKQNKEVFVTMLVILQFGKKQLQKEERAPYSAVEFAIFDLWSRIVQQSLTNFIFPDEEVKKCKKPCSFYSISNDIHSQMIENISQGLKYTSFIKLKCSSNVDDLLQLMLKIQEQVHNKIIKYIVDANASWSYDVCHYFIEKIKEEKYSNILEKILYLEQPFPVVISIQDVSKWQSLLQKCSGVLKIVADQSFFCQQDLDRVRKYCHGINIKTEKAGGVISSVKAGIIGKEQKMQIMLGSMVTTHLGATQTYCLHPLTQYLDTDGALLVEEPKVKGGFQWGDKGYLNPSISHPFGSMIDQSSFK